MIYLTQEVRFGLSALVTLWTWCKHSSLNVGFVPRVQKKEPWLMLTVVRVAADVPLTMVGMSEFALWRGFNCLLMIPYE